MHIDCICGAGAGGRALGELERMRSMARRALGGVFAAIIAAAAVCPAYAPAYADELQVAATAAMAIPPPVPVPAHRVTGTRFVIGLDGAVKFQIFSLSHPNRVVIELPEV